MRIDTSCTTPQYVGTLKQEVITRLGLQCKPGPIYIGPTNIAHIRTKHPVEFALHLEVQCPTPAVKPEKEQL